MFYDTTIPCEGVITIHTEAGDMFQIKQDALAHGPFQLLKFPWGSDAKLLLTTDSLMEALIEIQSVCGVSETFKP